MANISLIGLYVIVPVTEEWFGQAFPLCGMVNPDIEKGAFGRLVLSFRLVAHATSHVA